MLTKRTVAQVKRAISAVQQHRFTIESAWQNRDAGLGARQLDHCRNAACVLRTSGMVHQRVKIRRLLSHLGEFREHGSRRILGAFRHVANVIDSPTSVIPPKPFFPRMAELQIAAVARRQADGVRNVGALIIAWLPPPWLAAVVARLASAGLGRAFHCVLPAHAAPAFRAAAKTSTTGEASNSRILSG